MANICKRVGNTYNFNVSIKDYFDAMVNDSSTSTERTLLELTTSNYSKL